jgi:hypothetical protein
MVDVFSSCGNLTVGQNLDIRIKGKCIYVRQLPVRSSPEILTQIQPIVLVIPLVGIRWE